MTIIIIRTRLVIINVVVVVVSVDSIHVVLICICVEKRFAVGRNVNTMPSCYKQPSHYVD